jgi:octaprenyl-diphosphate synthase
VVDDSNERRGFFSVNALWKNKIAVLVGDYLLSRGLLLSVDNGDFHLLQIVSRAVREMSEGELLQIEKARRLDITEPVYFDIIQKKTASLLAACCASGTASVQPENKELIETMRQFGEYVGMAFQIKDDLFDYGSAGDIGKPTGIDIKEKKMTLPLIYALNKADNKDKQKIINIVKNHNEDPRRVQEVIDYVVMSGGIAYAEKKMNEFIQQAIQLMDVLPESKEKNALLGLVHYTIERKK